LLNEVNRYDLKWRKILEINSKIYAFDLWIRNSIVWYDDTNNREKILELVVLNHLLALWYDVKVWNIWNLEIDFVAKKNNETKYIQVCYLLSNQKIIDREFWNLLKIKDNYEKIVLSLDDFITSGYMWVKHYNLIEYICTLN
jgi:predicted AAA+ superfamily ATPase